MIDQTSTNPVGKFPLRIAFVLPGLHRVNRGAEVAFESIASELSQMPGIDVTLFGSGRAHPGDPYRFIHAGNIARERFEKFPQFPIFRTEYAWEEATFLPGFLIRYRPADFDVTVTCSYPFVQWAVQIFRNHRIHRPALIFVTQNGDHPVRSQASEFRWFDCDGLVCTNPEYYERNRLLIPSRLIPNGVDPSLFSPGKGERGEFGIPEGVPVALIVSALISSKRVDEGIRAAARLPDLHLVVCGDGPDREKIRSLGQDLMPGRFHAFSLPRTAMPRIYRCADVFLHMSLDEPFGIVYVEALATGLPVVTQDTNITRWSVGSNGVLVDATNSDAVAAGLTTALEKTNPQDVLERLDHIKKRFSWSGVAMEYYSFFLEILGRKDN